MSSHIVTGEMVGPVEWVGLGCVGGMEFLLVRSGTTRVYVVSLCVELGLKVFTPRDHGLLHGRMRVRRWRRKGDDIERERPKLRGFHCPGKVSA
eukprot:6404803-Pyramimonas_sp.AAC.1